MKKSALILMISIAALLLAAGCTTPAGPVTPQTTAPVTPGDTLPVTVSPSPAPLPSGTAVSLPPEDPGYTTQATRVAADDPYTEYFHIRKRTFNFPLPDCFMRNAFPAISWDNYGIRQVAPALAVVSEDDYYTFLRRHTEGNAESTPLKTPAACAGSGPGPTWNFVAVQFTVAPRNIRAADYAVTGNVLSDGKIVAKVETVKRMVLDEKVTFVWYIPVRTDELDLFDTLQISYARR